MYVVILQVFLIELQTSLVHSRQLGESHAVVKKKNKVKPVVFFCY